MKRHILAGLATAGIVVAFAVIVYLTILTEGLFFIGVLVAGGVVALYFSVLTEMDASRRHKESDERWETQRIGGRLKP